MSTEGTVEVIVGRIVRPHGVRGELVVDVATDEVDKRFSTGSTVHHEDRAWVIAASRWHSGRLIVRLEGIDDRNAAESLRGIRLWADVDISETPEKDDEFFDRHLIGLAVKDVHGVIRGKVSRVYHNGAQDLLAVDCDGIERLIPFVEALVPIVNCDEGYIGIADIDGLLDDNAQEAR